MKQSIFANCFMGLFFAFSPWVVSAQENSGPIGTALAAEVNGDWYILPTTEISGQVVPVTKVGFLDGNIIMPEKMIGLGDWVVDEENKTIRTNTEYICYLYVPADESSTLTITHFKSTIPNYWEPFLLDEQKQAWRFTKWGSEVKRFLSMYQHEDKGCVATYVPMSEYEQNPKKYSPVTDYPIYDGWYRHYDTKYLYATFCPSRDVASVADMSGAEFYSLQGKAIGEDGQVQLVFDGPCSNLEAGKPYLLKRDEGVTTVSLLYSGERVAVPVSCNGMIGSFSGIGGGAELTGKYVLYQNRFVKCAPGSSLIEQGAYIDMEEVPELSGPAAPGALSFALPGNNGATGIEVPRYDGNPVVRVYSMDGKLLLQTAESDWYEKLMPGFYIVNGKKIRK